MSRDTKDGGPAFVGDGWSVDGVQAIRGGGLTVRDWFAGQALVAIGAADMRSEMPIVPETMARNAYALADAMMAERAKGADGHG